MRIAVLISCEVWCWLIPFSSLNGAWFLQLIFDCASCGAWAPEAWKPRFQIFANLWKFNNRWNLKTWFLKIVYQRVSLSKIWAIHQNGRWRTILDPDRQPFLNNTTVCSAIYSLPLSCFVAQIKECQQTEHQCTTGEAQPRAAFRCRILFAIPYHIILWEG